MSTHVHPEEKKLLQIIEKAPFADADKTRFAEAINANGLTEEIAEEIQKTLTAIPKDKFSSEWQHAKINMDLLGVLKNWRMSQGSKKFKHNR